MQQLIVSKSKFKAKALEYFRMVQTTGNPMLVSHDDKPVIQVSLYNPRSVNLDFKDLFGSVIEYSKPFEPVGLSDWEVLK